MDSTYPLVGRRPIKLTGSDKFLLVILLLFVGSVSYSQVYSYCVALSIEALITDDLVAGATAEQVEMALTKRGLPFTYNEKEHSYRTKADFRPYWSSPKRFYSITVCMGKDRRVMSCTVVRRYLI